MTVAEIIEKRGNARENLLQILHDIQDQEAANWLPAARLEEVAQAMGLTISDIVGTASFYSMFSLSPRGRHIVRLCESPPCYIMGEENILQALEACLGVGIGETTADGAFTLETTSCLGTCGVAPVMMIDDVVYGNLTAAKVAVIIDGIRSTDGN